jgi:hypothetical protein
MAAAQKPAKRLGGMAEALAIAGDLGFPAPPAQVNPHPFPRAFSINFSYQILPQSFSSRPPPFREIRNSRSICCSFF